MYCPRQRSLLRHSAAPEGLECSSHCAPCAVVARVGFVNTIEQAVPMDTCVYMRRGGPGLRMCGGTCVAARLSMQEGQKGGLSAGIMVRSGRAVAIRWRRYCMSVNLSWCCWWRRLLATGWWPACLQVLWLALVDDLHHLLRLHLLVRGGPHLHRRAQPHTGTGRTTHSRASASQSCQSGQKAGAGLGHGCTQECVCARAWGRCP